MNEQIRAGSTATTATASGAAECGAAAGAAPEDAWDRLAALAFGGVSDASGGGCSEHAHACACRARGGRGRAAHPEPYPNTEIETAD